MVAIRGHEWPQILVVSELAAVFFCKMASTPPCVPLLRERSWSPVLAPCRAPAISRPDFSRMHASEDVWARRLKAAQESELEKAETKQTNSEYAEDRSGSENPDLFEGNFALGSEFFSFSSAFRIVKKRKIAPEETTSRDVAKKCLSKR